jgi:hypothetical protein
MFEARRQLQIGRWRGGEDRRIGETILGVGKIEIARESRDEEVVVVAPNLGAPDEFQPVIDRVDAVLRDTIAGRIEPIITDEIAIGDACRSMRMPVSR